MTSRTLAKPKSKVLVLKGQDLLLAFHLAGASGETQTEMAAMLGLSQGEVNGALRRLQAAQLVTQGSRKVIRPNLIEFALHGARYAFPPVSGGTAGGVPTGTLASPLAEEVNAPECAFVWRYADGQVRAATLSPIYPSAPFAALKNPAMHRKLALLDGIRTGGVRVRQISVELLRKELERGE